MSEVFHQHLPPATLRAYRDGHTAPAETLAVSDALAECPGCRAALAALPLAPAYEDIAAAADRGLDPAAGDAFADDAVARAELADLLSFRREMAGQAGETLGPAPESGQVETDGKIVAVPRTFWQRKRWLALSAAAATLAVLAGGWWMSASFGDGDDARRLLTDRQGKRVALAALPADLREAVGGTLHAGHLPTAPALAGLNPRAGTLAGTADGAAFKALSPMGVVVRGLQPTLRWTTCPGAEVYHVFVVDTEGGERRFVDSFAPATEGEVSPLTPGHTYEWQVEAVAGGETIDRAPKPPTPEARFRVLGEAEQAALAKAEARYGQYPLVMAVAYARAGLVDEEAAALDRLAREHPQSPLAQRLHATHETAASR